MNTQNQEQNSQVVNEIGKQALKFLPWIATILLGMYTFTIKQEQYNISKNKTIEVIQQEIALLKARDLDYEKRISFVENTILTEDDLDTKFDEKIQVLQLKIENLLEKIKIMDSKLDKLSN